jgi:hypothetical protein
MCISLVCTALEVQNDVQPTCTACWFSHMELAQMPVHLTWIRTDIFHGFLQSLQMNTGQVLKMGHDHHTSIPYLLRIVYHLPMSFSIICCYSCWWGETMSLNCGHQRAACCSSPSDVWACRAMVEWFWLKTEELGEEPVQVQLCPSWIPHRRT